PYVNAPPPPARRSQGDCMSGCVKVQHFSGARRPKAGGGGIDGYAVADQLLREDGIGHTLERINEPGKRTFEQEGFGHGKEQGWAAPTATPRPEARRTSLRLHFRTPR